SHYDTLLSVFTRSPSSLTSIGCNEGSGGVPSDFVFDTVAGRTYYFMVGASGEGFGGKLVFSVSSIVPPTNDEITSAITIPTLPYSSVIDTTGAIVANDDPYACGYEGHTVWYAFTPTVPVRIEASTAGSDYSAGLAVLTGTR